MTPLQAVTQADPYPFYAHLRARPGLYFDAHVNAWIASDARTIQAVLEHPACVVRPLGEPVPAALGQGPAGETFRRLMRMNEGPAHLCPRAAIAPALAAIPAEAVNQAVARAAKGLGDLSQDLDALMFTLPVSTVAALIGFPDNELQDIAGRVRAFVACLSPLSDATALCLADQAAAELNERVGALWGQAGYASELVNLVRQGCDEAGRQGQQALVANLIGLMSQTCEATAALIGNALVALHRAPQLVDSLRSSPALIADWVAEVARHDAPVQNTRRFVARRCTVHGQVLEAGDAIVLLLASANRDANVNISPDRFMLHRPQRPSFSFGGGRHQCPGQALALLISAQAVSLWLHQAGPTTRSLGWDYWPSLNARIPRFQQAVGDRA